MVKSRKCNLTQQVAAFDNRLWHLYWDYIV